ncbi:MAG: TonB family protein [Bryobacterales bacterium]|nr:TonB family protein [Bryobacterales bacterium]MBV9398555.1 TonB family protein [Bryobacterales bacterium]
MLAAPPAETAELNLLREWREPITRKRLLRDAVGSVAVHAVIISAVLLAPDAKLPIQETPSVDIAFKKATPLYIPRVLEPTQKDPNKGQVTRGLDLRSATEGQPAQAKRFRPPVPAPGAPAPAQATISALEAPKIEALSGAPMAPTIGVGAPSAGPPPPAEHPKLVFESVTGGTSPKPNPNPDVKLNLPKPTPQLAKLPPRPGGGGGVTVGDIGEMAPPLTGAPVPAPCQECSTLQLLSDPQNVDFKPYLQQVLALVKRNWLSVIPESARLGRRGVVLLQFSIDRRGLVPKVVIATPSGVEAFDRAAVAGLSMSNPLPPLPIEYKGDQVRLQMAFSYNVASQR